MVPSRYLCLAFGLLVACDCVSAQTVVNSTFLNRHPVVEYDEYNNPNNWNPGEVPNNTAAKLFDVDITTFFQVGVPIDVTISNLTLGGSTTGLLVAGKTFTVTGSTTREICDGYVEIASNPGAPGKFDAGTFSSFSDHTLRGHYVLRDATLQFRSADIWSFRDGNLNLHGALSAVVDESGNDALRNLRRIEASASFVLDGRNFVTNAPFLNEGIVSLQAIPEPSMFTAAAGLRNFDASTRTLSGGRFDLAGGELRFEGADVVDLASTIYLSERPGLTDLVGNDGIRNLAHIRQGGVLNIARDFTSVGSFTNDGQLALSGVFTVTGALSNFDATSRTLTGGKYSIFQGVFRFSGADIVHNQASIILAQDNYSLGSQSRITDLAGNDGLRNFSDNRAGGSFILSPGQLFLAPGNFTNAGTITTSAKVPIHDDRALAEFRVPPGSSYTQTAGMTVNAGIFSAENSNILGGTFINRTLGYNVFGIPTPGQVKGNLNISNGTLVAKGTISGNLTLGANARFHPTIGAVSDSVSIQGSTALGGTLEVELTGYRFPENSEVITVLQSSGPMSGTFSNAVHGARIGTIDGGGSFAVVYESNAVRLTGFEMSPSPAQLLNISTRAALSAAEDDPQGDRSILIAGFIISGAEPKKVVLRGIGPSLANAGVGHVLPDPTLELHAGDGSIILTNNDWRETQQAELIASGLAPQDDREAAVVVTLVPGTYTVVIREKDGLEGTGLVEVYDVSGSSNSKLANISTRGFTDDVNPLIGGIIAGGPGQATAELVVRGVGPSLHYAGVVNALNDLVLELRDANGNPVGSNQEATAYPREIPIAFRGLGPGESAIRVSLPRGNYTALVWAKPNRSGIALVEFYDLRQ